MRHVIFVFAVTLALVTLSLMPAYGGLMGLKASVESTGEDFWGTSETFWNITTGTNAPGSFNDVTLHYLKYSDSVVLDGWLYQMTRENGEGRVITYTPSGPAERTGNWNISVEITRPREGSSYEASNISYIAGNQSLATYLVNETGAIVAGVQLIAGNQSNERVQILDSMTLTWANATYDIRPAFPHDNQSYGMRPDRYIVSYGYSENSTECTVTVRNTGSGVIFTGNATLIGSGIISSPSLRFDVKMATGRLSVYQVSSGWIIDNLMFRSLHSRYPVVGPVYEFVGESDPIWIDVRDADGLPITDASVDIEHVSASYDPAAQRYEAVLPRLVDWDAPFNYTAVVDGITVNDRLLVSTTPDPVTRVSIPRWWNGWDWVTVFGRDDCLTPLGAPEIYADFEHPKTSYMQLSSQGSSSDILRTQSEIALHSPHDYYYWNNKNWTEANMSANMGHSNLISYFTFASRWDDPSYVGRGDSYISLASPGNHASWEQVFAQYKYGTRMMGISSHYYVAGNSSLMGSYWIYGSEQDQLPEWGSWHPYNRMDLMDTWRGLNTEVENSNQWNIAHTMAENNGLLRIYNHREILNNSFLTWMCDNKTNYSYENWKATDGEAASYTYGRLSTDVSMNSSWNSAVWAYDVSRRSPYDAGYWNVPVTLAIDISEKQVLDIEIQEGNWTLRMSDGSLADLDGKRIMDVGYDIRGDTLYVSHFWNSSATLKVFMFALTNPRIDSAPVTGALAWEDYSCPLTSTPPDDGPSIWSIDTDANWLSIEASNDTWCLLTGFPKNSGTYTVRLTVSDLNSTAYLNWTIDVVRLKFISGRVRDIDGTPVVDSIVMVSIKSGDDIRSVKYGFSDKGGRYEIEFPESEWLPGDTVYVSAFYNESSAENDTVVSDYPYQEIDIQFTSLIPEFGGAAQVVAVISSVVILVAIVLPRRRR